MKKQLLIGSVLLAAISAYSQTSRTKPKPSGVINVKIMAETKFSDAKPASQGVNPADLAVPETEPSQGGLRAATTNTWNNFTASMNIYGVSNGHTKPLQWNDELNAVSFIHRKSPTYEINPAPASTAENGAIVAMISNDCGGTWDSTAIYANDNFWGRYPSGAIYNPPMTPVNKDMYNTYIVGAGPTTGVSTGWIGNWFASKQLGLTNYDNTPSTDPGAQQVVATLGPYPGAMTRADFAAYGFAATDDGKMRILGGIRNDALSPAADSAVTMLTATFNPTSSTFDWTSRNFHLPVTEASDGSSNFVSRPIMAWNEAGTVGYMVVMGSRDGADSSNIGYQPIVFMTTDSGANWTLDSVGINFNGNSPFADVKRSLVTVSMDSTLEVPWFYWGEGYDCVVDMNNKLHIFTSVIGHFSNHPDSLDYLSQYTTERYKWPHRTGYQPYLYDFTYNGSTWSHMTIDSMTTEGPGQLTTDAGYNDNPWDPDPAESNQKISLDARLQLSRTPDGKYIVYTWAESDTTATEGQRKWNKYPDIKARVLNAATGSLHPTKLNVTTSAPGEIKKRAMFHVTSPKCRLSSTVTANGPAISIPLTVSNSNPYTQKARNKHWFSWATLNFGNVPDADIVVCPAAPTQTVDGTGVAENSFNSASSSYVFPNPAKNNATVNVNLLHTSKVQIDVLNTVGQVVRTTRTEGQSGKNSIAVDLNGLASGIYLVNVKIDDASSTKKLVIE
jgi:hypothetical protein